MPRFTAMNNYNTFSRLFVVAVVIIVIVVVVIVVVVVVVVVLFLIATLFCLPHSIPLKP